jgi:ABC-type transport system involved in cytochrome c biogenesis permease subunit
MKKWMPWICAGVFALWFVSGAQAPKRINGFDIAGFGRLPVLLNGRVQPFDSVARNALLSMSGRSLVRVQDAPALSPSEWLLEAMSRPEVADQRRIFRVQHPDLESFLGAQKEGLQYYSYNDIAKQLDNIESQIRKLQESEGDKGDDAEKLRNPYQKDLMHLYNSVGLYNRLKANLAPASGAEFQKELAAFQQAIIQAQTNAAAAPDAGSAGAAGEFLRVSERAAEFAYVRAVPPPAGQPRTGWVTVGATFGNSPEAEPPVAYYAQMSAAYQAGDATAFNRAVAGYRVWLQASELAPELKKGGEEFLFNQTEPFYKSMVIYIAAVLLGCVFWINLSEPLRRAGVALLVVAFVIHTFGLGYRIFLEGRPPVTNLYSSAIFIGWGAVLMGIILERIFKGGIGLVASGLIGFTTLIIAHHLALSGDTMEMLRAVLDTNFWLSTHVVTITIGYSSMFLAGLLAAIYIVRGFFTRSLAAETARALARMVYGIVCFATLTSFVGTILGGIWADQSWGRFWGWDPKENGALLIVIWNAIILHARWGGLVKERGLMAMAVFGNIVTSFSWFGVNMLGVGLHSYGFMDQAFYWLMLFDASQAALILLALLPSRFWASFKTEAPSAAPVQPGLVSVAKPAGM